MGKALVLAFITVLATASSASAGVPHVVQPGETLWTIAAANNFTTRSLAAANGLSEDSQVILGSTIQIPSEAEAAAALQRGQTPYAPVRGQTPYGGVTSAGGHLVQPGETLSGIA